jgi:iron complex outermembrane receptor protein
VDRTATFATNVAKTDISGVSPVTADLSYIRTFDLRSGQVLEAGLDARYRAGYDFAAINQLDLINGLARLVKVDSQVTGNAHLSWITDRFSLTGYVRNISDERYIDSGSVVPGAGVPGGPAPANIVVARYAEPRTYGVILAAKF